MSVGSATRHYYHVKILAAAGMDVEVVTASRSTISGSQILRHKYQQHVNINLVPVGTVSSDNIFSRIKYHAQFFFRSLRRIIRTRKPTLVIASIPSLLIGWQGYLAARLCRAKFLIDVRDLWSDSLATTNLAHLPLFLPLNRLLERVLYQKADLIICTSESQAETIRRMLSKQVPVHFVPNGLDPEIRITSSQTHPLIHKIKQKYDWIGLYAGKHSQYACLETLISAAKELAKDKFAFLFVGGGYAKAELLNRAKKEELKNVFFHDPVPKKEISSFLMGADMFFINYSRAQAWRNVLPNKVFDYMYWNCPIIAAVVPGEITRVLSESGAGVGVPPENPEAIVKAVRQYLKNKSWKINSRDYLLLNFDRHKTTIKFFNACQQVLNGKRI